MIRNFAKALLPLAVLISPAIAWAEEQPISLSLTQREAVDEAKRRGELIYLYDQAAWHTTDAMLEDIKDPARAGVRGWIVVPEIGDLRFKAIYYGRDEEGPFEVYSAVWDGSSISNRHLSDNTKKLRLTDEQQRLVTAIDAVNKVDWQMCNKLPPNLVVLPRIDSSKPDSVYVLTPQPDVDRYSLGGHTRFDVRDGKIITERKFANSCLTMSKNDGRKTGDATASFFVTHLIDDIPTEIHVFTMLTARTPIVVMTTQNNLAWSIGRLNGDVVIEVEHLPPSDTDK